MNFYLPFNDLFKIQHHYFLFYRQTLSEESKSYTFSFQIDHSLRRKESSPITVMIIFSLQNEICTLYRKYSASYQYEYNLIDHPINESIVVAC